MPSLDKNLPAVYRAILPAFFERTAPDETKATCASCAMCAGGAKGVVAPIDGVTRLFRSDTKCCTYHPRLPNFLVGALLADDSAAMAEGRRRALEQIESHVGVTPQWLRPPAAYNALYDGARDAFGRAAALRCPYYDSDGGGCTIWPYREAVCSTFFCKYVAGADGRKFWATLKTYLTLSEVQLSRAAIFELHRDHIVGGHDRAADRPRPLSSSDLDGYGPSEKDYGTMWGPHAGREVDFYLACHDYARSLDRAGFERLMGFDGTAQLAVLEKVYRDATEARLPERLKLDSGATVHWLDDGSVAFAAYSEFDAVSLPGEAYALLTEFTGRDTVDEVRARLREKRHADLAEDVLMVLYRHRVLVEP